MLLLLLELDKSNSNSNSSNNNHHHYCLYGNYNFYLDSEVQICWCVSVSALSLKMTTRSHDTSSSSCLLADWLTNCLLNQDRHTTSSLNFKLLFILFFKVKNTHLISPVQPTNTLLASSILSNFHLLSL